MTGLRSVPLRRLAAAALPVIAFLGLLLVVEPVAAQTEAAVEYYYDVWNFYFETSFPDEIAALDGGAFGGAWRRTGQTFNVWPQPNAMSSPTCRFFSTAFAPKSSHFYTPFPNECAVVKTEPGWQYEAIAFYIALADANGVCPAGTIALFRAYDNGMGGAPNHRYTTSLTILNQMIAAGWVFEGNGNTKAFACVPPSPPPPVTPEGFWFGTTTTGVNLYVFVLDTGLYYLLYTSTAGNFLAGVVEGTLTSSNGNFSSSDALDFAIGHGVAAAMVTGSFTARATINGVVSEAAAGFGFSVGYRAVYDQPVSLGAAAGTFSGQISSSSSQAMNAVITLDATGALSGSVGNCTFGGTASPHGAVNVLNVVFTFNGGPCSHGTSTFQGIAHYFSNELYGAAPNAARTDALIFVVNKP